MLLDNVRFITMLVLERQYNTSRGVFHKKAQFVIYGIIPLLKAAYNYALHIINKLEGFLYAYFMEYDHKLIHNELKLNMITRKRT